MTGPNTNVSPGVTNAAVPEPRMTEGGQQTNVRNAERDLSNDRPQASAPVGRVQTSRADILEMQELDPTTVDPNRHYRWVRFEDGRVRKLERQGYEIETHRKGGPKPLGTPDNTTDGSIRMGDLVLMSCPKELREATEARQFQSNQTRLGTVATEQIKDHARRIGADLSDQSKET